MSWSDTFKLFDEKQAIIIKFVAVIAKIITPSLMGGGVRRMINVLINIVDGLVRNDNNINITYK